MGFASNQKVIDESVLNEVAEDLDIKTLRSDSSNEWLCGCVEPGQIMAQNGDLGYPNGLHKPQFPALPARAPRSVLNPMHRIIAAERNHLRTTAAVGRPRNGLEA